MSDYQEVVEFRCRRVYESFSVNKDLKGLL